MTAYAWTFMGVVVAAMGTLLGIIVREMNNTAEKVAFAVGDAAKQAAETQTTLLAGKLTLIEDATNRMRTVVNELYDYSHAGKHELRTEVAKSLLLIDTHLTVDHPKSELNHVRRSGDLERLIEIAKSVPKTHPTEGESK